MMLWRMLMIALRMARPCWLMPWRSPLLRWRMETYGVRDAQGRLLHASDMTAAQFVRFLATHRRALWAYLRWAAEGPAASRALRRLAS